MKTWQYFWQLIKFRPRYYATDLGWVTVHFALRTVTGLILRAYFNMLTGEEGVGLALGAVVALQAGWIVLSVVSFYLAVMGYVNFTQHGMALLIRNMLARILQLPGAAALASDEDGKVMSTGKVISTLRDDVDEMVGSIIIIDDFVALSVTAVIAFAIMFSINPIVTLGTFVPLAFIIMIAQALGGRARRYRQVSRRATSEVTGMIADMFNATQAIKVGNAEERIIQRFRQVSDQRREAMVKDRLLTQLVDALSNGTVDVGLGLILLLAAQAMQRGEFTVGDFALFAAYIWPATHLMRTTGNLLTRYRQVGVSTQRMEAIMQGQPTGSIVEHNPIYMSEPYPVLAALPKADDDRLEILSVKGLSFHYPTGAVDGNGVATSTDGSQGIDAVTLELKRGSFTVITGRIGSGKSTLLRALLGLLPWQSGEILWNGRPVRDPTSFLVPPRVAYTGQVPRLFSETLRDNILLGLSEKAIDLERAIKTAVLERDLTEMAGGLETMVGPRGVRLSGGQNQRTAAARMFVREAELLVFDDLSSALDVETERLLWERLFERESRPTCLVVSHRRTALQRADHIIVMQDGRIVDEGTLYELLDRSPEMKALWRKEAE